MIDHQSSEKVHDCRRQKRTKSEDEWEGGNERKSRNRKPKTRIEWNENSRLMRTSRERERTEESFVKMRKKIMGVIKFFSLLHSYLFMFCNRTSFFVLQ